MLFPITRAREGIYKDHGSPWIRTIYDLPSGHGLLYYTEDSGSIMGPFPDPKMVQNGSFQGSGPLETPRINRIWRVWRPCFQPVAPVDGPKRGPFRPLFRPISSLSRL